MSFTLLKQPQPGILSQKKDMELIQKLWTPQDQRLLERLEKDIRAGPTLAITDPHPKFYIKTDWYKDVMEVALLKVEESAEARKLESN